MTASAAVAADQLTSPGPGAKDESEKLRTNISLRKFV